MDQRKKRLAIGAAIAVVITMFVITAGMAAWPTTPYGAKNATVSAKLLAWKTSVFAGRGIDYSYLPINQPGHGTEVPGEIGTIATDAELEAYLNNIQSKSRGTMKWKYVFEYNAVQNDGALETPAKPIKLAFAVFSKEGVFEPEDVKALKRPVVWLQGEIHGDESSGSESMQVTAYRLTQGDLRHILDKVVVIMLPRANPEGAWRWTRGNNGAVPTGGNPSQDPNRDNIWFESILQRAVHKTMNAYAPHVVLDQHEMGLYKGDEYAYVNGGAVKTGNTLDYVFDVSILNAPHPALNRKIAVDIGHDLLEANWRRDLDAKKVRWTVYEAFSGTKNVDGMVLSSDMQTMVPGYRVLKSWRLEADGDPRMVDPSYGLKGAASFLTEVPSPKPRVMMNSRTFGHNVFVESLLNTVYENADKVRNTVEEGRQETADLGKTVEEEDKLTLGYMNAPGYNNPENCTESYTEYYIVHSADADGDGSPDIVEISNDVKVGRMMWDPYKTGDKAGQPRFGYVPASVITRPYAYLFEAEPETIDRLVCTGVKLHRLTSDVTLDVTAFDVKKVEVVTINGRPISSTSLLCDAGSQPFGFNVSGDIYEKHGVQFKKGTYVMFMAQPIAPYGALSLDPQSCWNYANLWVLRSGKGKTGLLSAEVGKDFPVYRLMTAKDLPTEELPDLSKFVGAETPHALPLSEESGFVAQAAKIVGSVLKPVDLYIPNDGITGKIVDGEYLVSAASMRNLYRSMGGDGRRATGMKWVILNKDGETKEAVLNNDGSLTIDMEEYGATDDNNAVYVRMAAQSDVSSSSGSSGCNAGFAGVLLLMALALPVITYKRS